jgi:hypothetical protein
MLFLEATSSLTVAPEAWLDNWLEVSSEVGNNHMDLLDRVLVVVVVVS